MLSIRKCIKRGAATTLLLLAAITIQADNVMKRHADGTCSVNTRTICKARGYRKGTPVEVYFKNGKVLKVVALKNEENSALLRPHKEVSAATLQQPESIKG